MSTSSDRSEPTFDTAAIARSTTETSSPSTVNSAVSARERALARAFVGLADIVVDTVDVDDVLAGLSRSCVELLPVSAAAVLLTDERGEPYVAAATSEVARQEIVAEIATAHGPCPESLRTGAPVVDHPCPAVPLRWRDEVIGALGLFGDRSATLGSD
ncbi:MAG TPA: hypothetical protein VI076_07830, partial [Actinopolymorphaceae bacterium]